MEFIQVFPEFHVNIKLSSFFSTGEGFWGNFLNYTIFGTTLP